MIPGHRMQRTDDPGVTETSGSRNAWVDMPLKTRKRTEKGHVRKDCSKKSLTGRPTERTEYTEAYPRGGEHLHAL